MKISDYIPTGRENAISRARLSAVTGMDDRTLRAAIKKENKGLVQEGKAILSSSAARGYWIAEAAEELEAYLRESEHRSRSQYKNDAPIRALVVRLRGLREVPVREHTRRIKNTGDLDGQITFEGGTR